MLIIGFASVDCDWQGLQALYKCSLLFQQGGGWERRLHACSDAAMHACVGDWYGRDPCLRFIRDCLSVITVGWSTHGGLGSYCKEVTNSRSKQDVGDESALNR